MAPLSNEAGALLSDTLGVKGTRQERERLAAEVRGHALTLTIIGGYLRDAYSGDIRRRDQIKLDEADAEEQGGHAFRAMDAYAKWFESDGERGRQALAILRLLGLFDRPADAGCLAALWRAPSIDGLTEPLIALSEAQRNIALTRLGGAELVTVNRAGGALLSLDAHPLLREYFAKALRERQLGTWKAAHKRLYEHLTTKKDNKPAPTLEDLQPLYQAVAHGCLAGLQQEACDDVYYARISREAEFFVSRKLGAYGADLGAVACFFDAPWRRISPNLTPPDQAWLLNGAAFALRALGRLTEALEPMRAGLENYVGQENWLQAAISASNLSELELTLGEVEPAIRDGEASVGYAERSGDGFQRMTNRVRHADALSQAGRRAEAEALFNEAQAMQAARQPQLPLLYSLQGFLCGDLVLDEAGRDAWLRIAGDGASETSQTLEEACGAVAERADKTIEIAVRNNWLLDIGLDHLTLACAGLYQAILRREQPASEHLQKAVDFLRRSGSQHHLPRALLTRALFRAVTGAFDGVHEDLDEAYEIAERGPMRLFLGDIRLHRARLFGLMPSRPAAYPWTSPRDDLDAAKKRIDECGYGRRREELADAEAAYQRVYGRTRDLDGAWIKGARRAALSRLFSGADAHCARGVRGWRIRWRAR